MSRVIDDPVFVRTRSECSRPGGSAGVTDPQAPDQFIWRDRLYVVDEVIAHWRERQAWWSRPAALAVHGLDSGAAPATAVDLVAAADREVWKVSAAIGRRSPGVFVLSADGAVDTRSWRLLELDD